MDPERPDDFEKNYMEILRSLPQEIAPPGKLEDRVVSSVMAQVTASSRWGAALRAAVFAGLSLILFGGGLFLGLSQSKKTSGVSMSQSTYVLFLLEGPQYDQPSGTTELQERVIEYRNWVARTRKETTAISGIKLHDRSLILPSDKSVDVEPTEIGGYFLIEAVDMQTAIRIAETCPHLRHGGRIEVRQIDPV